MPSTAKSRNLFGLFEKTTVHKTGGLTRRDVKSQAYKAGQRSGDSGEFRSWVKSKNLDQKWDRDSIREFESSYRDGVEKGEAIEAKKEAKREAIVEKRETAQKEKEQGAEVKQDVVEALAGMGMSRGTAKVKVSAKYSSGDNFDSLFRKVMARSNPAMSASALQGQGWKLIDRYETRATASDIAVKYAPYRLVYRSGKWEVWTKQAGSSANPRTRSQAVVKELAKREHVNISIAAHAYEQAGGNVEQAMTLIKKLRSEGRLSGTRSSKNPLDAAEKLYKDFTGLPPTQVLEFEEKEHFHKVTTVYGKLVCLDILTVDGRVIPLVAPGFVFEPKKFLPMEVRHTPEADSANASWILKPGTKDDSIVLVTFSEDGRQMIFRGGDQAIPYKEVGLTERDVRDNMFIGTILQVTYRGKKKFEMEGREEVDFHHSFGEQGSGGVMPLLIYKLRTKRMETAGGRYKTAPVRSDIGASPGVVG